MGANPFFLSDNKDENKARTQQKKGAKGNSEERSNQVGLSTSFKSKYSGHRADPSQALMSPDGKINSVERAMER